MYEKLKDRGYWVSKHYYWQSLLLYFYQCLKYRSFSYFSICNPKIHFGGMLDDEKSQVYPLIDQKYIPRTAVISSAQDIETFISHVGHTYPFVLKPNIGFKGYQVHIVEDADMLDKIIDRLDYAREWIAQEYIAYQREFSILYHRLPYASTGYVSSFVEKKYPFVTGDGKRTLKQLIHQYSNPFIHKEALFDSLEKDLDRVLSIGEDYILHRIGNYSRGSKFYSLQNEIDPQLNKEMDLFHKGLDGIDFFRIDCKSDSIEDIKRGKYKIMELNGMKSEPLHIYDPNSSFWSNMRDIQHHWNHISQLVDAKRKIMNFDLPTTSQSWKAKQHTKKLVP